MNWLAKLFKGTFSAASSPNPNISEPERELPIDEAFVKNFKDKGGIFVYIEKKLYLCSSTISNLKDLHLILILQCISFKN